MMTCSRYRSGDRVRVRDDYPIGHIRTPVYIRGCEGQVVRYLGHFGNPETLAFCLPTEPRELYKVQFRQVDVWPNYEGSLMDTVELDLYDHWLEGDHSQ
jgi:nitrile hydratase subunit beta